MSVCIHVAVDGVTHIVSTMLFPPQQLHAVDEDPLRLSDWVLSSIDGMCRPSFLSPLPTSRRLAHDDSDSDCDSDCEDPMPRELRTLVTAVDRHLGSSEADKFKRTIACTLCGVPWTRHAVGGVGCPGFKTPGEGCGYDACVACGLPFLFHDGARKYLSFVRAQHGSPRPVDHKFVRRSATVLSFIRCIRVM